MRLISIGSSTAAHLQLSSRYVSGYHAELLLLDNGDILLTDKGSKNGTFLNDMRLTPNKEVAVKHGDNIRLADMRLDWNAVPTIPLPDLSKVKGIYGIGTNFHNKYQLQGEKVSRFHATFKEMRNGKWYIQDHSKNGTTVNGKTIPPDQDIPFKRGDAIVCAGIPVPNPIPNPPINWRMIGVVASVAVLICFSLYGLKRYMGRGDRGGKPAIGKLAPMTDTQIYHRYNTSTALLVGYFYYKVTAGNLDLDKIGLPVKVSYNPQVKGGLVKVESSEQMIGYTGTGFFVSADGKIVTNLHMTRPWLYGQYAQIASKISDQYKMTLEQYADVVGSELRAFTSQVKVEGVLNSIGLIPNGKYFSDANFIHCRELTASSNAEVDVAILQTETMKLAEGTTAFINLDSAVVDDSQIEVGAHVYTLGFPFGVSLQDMESSKGIQLLGNGGSITQKPTDYSFGFNAPSYHGASGSPIFNEYGQLIGVLNAGVDASQGFNFAIKAKYVKELLDKTK